MTSGLEDKLSACRARQAQRAQALASAQHAYSEALAAGSDSKVSAAKAAVEEAERQVAIEKDRETSLEQQIVERDKADRRAEIAASRQRDPVC